MNIGRERTTGKIFLADSAQIVRHRRYICPECSAPLIHHEETIHKIAFFAHRPHTADPDCKLYFAPDETDCRQLARERVFRLREPSLRLRILGEQGDGLLWQACMLIPKFDRATSLSLEDSPVYGRINVSALKDGGTPIAVYPQSSDYTIITFEPELPPDRLLVEGFSEVTIFHFTPDLCRRVHAREPLVRGDAYVVVHRDPAITRSMPQYLQSRALIPLDGWRGQAFRVPLSPTGEVVRWFSTKLNKAVADDKRAASVILPTDAYRQDDDTWIVPAGDSPVIVAVDFGTAEEAPRSLMLVHGDGEPPETLFLSPLRHAYVRIEALNVGLHELRCAADGETLLTLSVGADDRRAASCDLYFIFAGKEGPRTEYLWGRDLERYFEAVSVGLSVIVDVAVPAKAHVMVRTGHGASSRTTVIDGGESAEDSANAGDQLKKALETELATISPRIEIDAGSFGRFVLQSASPKHSSRRAPFDLVQRKTWLVLTGAISRKPKSRAMAETNVHLRAQIRQLEARRNR